MRDEVGRYIAEGVAVGISENTSVATAAMKELGDSVRAQAKKNLANDKKAAEKMNSEMIKVAKEKLKAHKQNNELTAEAESEYWDTVRKQFTEGTKERIEADQMYFDARKSIDDELLNAAKKRLDNHKVYNDMTLAEEAGFWDEIRVKFEEGSDARIEADKAYFDAKKSINEKILSAERSFTDKMLDAQKNLNDKLDEIAQKEADRKKEYLDSFDLFKKFDPESSGLDEATDLTLDLQAQVNSLKMYGDVIDSLESKLGGTALFDELSGFGMDDIEKLRVFDRMTAEELEYYTKLYEERSAIAAKFAQDDTEAERAKETQEAYSEYARILNEGIDELNETYFQVGVEIDASTADLASAFERCTAKIVEAIEDPIAAIHEAWDSIFLTDAMVEELDLSQFVVHNSFGKPSGYSLNSAYSDVMAEKAKEDAFNPLAKLLEKNNELMSRWLPAIAEACNIDLFINGRKFATELAPDMDDALGIISSRKERGR